MVKRTKNRRHKITNAYLFLMFTHGFWVGLSLLCAGRHSVIFLRSSRIIFFRDVGQVQVARSFFESFLLQFFELKTNWREFRGRGSLVEDFSKKWVEGDCMAPPLFRGPMGSRNGRMVRWRGLLGKRGGGRPGGVVGVGRGSVDR